MSNIWFVTLERDGDVFILHLNPDDENRFSPEWLTAAEGALDEAEKADGARALVTAGSGKFWSNGLDLGWAMSHEDEMAAYVSRVEALLGRTLASPVVTVAALNGHAFGAGAMWALAHDFRIMRADRGYFCLPEVDLGVTFAAGMSALLRARLTPQVAHVAMTTGHRYGGGEALAAAIVDAAVPHDRVLADAVGLARSLASKSTQVRGQIKEAMYANALAALGKPPAAA